MVIKKDVFPTFSLNSPLKKYFSPLGVTTQTILTIPVSQQVASSITKEQIFQNLTQLINRPDNVPNPLQQLPMPQSPILNSKFVCLPKSLWNRKPPALTRSFSHPFSWSRSSKSPLFGQQCTATAPKHPTAKYSTDSGCGSGRPTPPTVATGRRRCCFNGGRLV